MLISSRTLAIALFVTGAATALAADGNDSAPSGLLPLTELLTRISEDCRGELIEVEMDREDGEQEYEVTLLGPDGDVAELEFSARSGELLEAEGRNLDRLGCVPPRVRD